MNRQPLDYVSDERQRRLWERQESFRRNCFWLALGFMVIGGILTYNFWK